ncbi:hypothetical protein CKO28_02705 [Rhodovibrio sodomensis]|uniref:17 kDa surface antigen n=1 Tax=Rhodovibrio sodomensis TaxID=1088 RepID=A0ABS1DB68_9PROT|nr:RT0821/Lpp0805 family surface protein [Rhodovibrio sodomensis]MBK1666953.1 hypothetical protein [Rhodovibrio sodomensis]
MKRLFALLALVTLIASPASAEGLDRLLSKQNIGTVLGALGGGAAGAQIGKGNGKLVATGAGAVIGALIGNQVGLSLDRVDEMHAQRSTQHALERNRAGHATMWRNPDSGAQGSVRPVRTYQRASGQYCREFQHTVQIDGKVAQAYGTACRQPDGRWRIQQQ